MLILCELEFSNVNNNRSNLIISVMAFSAGTIVVNVYDSQPILNEIAETLGGIEDAVGKIAMLSNWALA